MIETLVARWVIDDEGFLGVEESKGYPGRIIDGMRLALLSHLAA